MSRPARRSAMRQSFSYHRLRDATVAERIVASTGLAPPDRVIEFGAGEGFLTRALAKRARHVTAIEIDRALHAKLARLAGGLSNVCAVHADFRDFRLPARDDYVVAANLPFSLTSETMRHLLKRANPPAAAYLIVQREAAATWTGTGRTTLRAVLAWPRFSFEAPLALRRRDFDPWPSVESVLLAIHRRKQPLLAPAHARNFEAFVSHAFNGGGSIARNLRGAAPTRKLATALDSLGVDGRAGPSSLSPAQWLALWRSLQC